jgi:hypothetical protein
VRKQCAMCPAEFEAKRATAKYCSARCRVRASRSQPRQDDASEMPADPSSELWSATLAELTAAGRALSAGGLAALALARRIDAADRETGSSLATLVREHRAALADAVRDGAAAVNPLDELRDRRERKFGAG